MDLYPSQEFLAKLGLTGGNPFSDTQAEAEDQLDKYFIDLPAFYKILDTDAVKPKSSILSAGRGCGKSANRRIVERFLKFGAPHYFRRNWPWKPSVLVVPYTDFSRLTALVNGDYSKIKIENHVTAILWLSVSALFIYLQESWKHLDVHKISEQYIHQLGYFLVNYSNRYSYLRNESLLELPQNSSLSRDLGVFLEYACRVSQKAKNIEAGGLVGLLKTFVELVSAFEINSVVILVDGVDEHVETADNPPMAATLIRSLIAEGKLFQSSGLYFKYFLPNEVVFELKRMPELRIGEKIRYYDVKWDDASLELLLSHRLRAFSNGILVDFGQLADVETKNVGQFIVANSQGNPRTLLRMSEWLLIHFERTSRAENENKYSNRSRVPRITKSVVDAMFESFKQEVVLRAGYPNDVDDTIRAKRIILRTSVENWEITNDMYVIRSGKILNSEKLSSMEYEILSYFFQKAGELVTNDELSSVLWKEKLNERHKRKLSQTILGLRKKIGSDSILSVRNIGYIFISSLTSSIEKKRETVYSPLKVFLSYAHSDKEEVYKLYKRLVKVGVDTWIDKERLLAGQDWSTEIRKAVKKSDVVVVCLSRQFSKAGFRQKEVRIALEESDMKPPGTVYIIPAKLEDCEVPDILAQWQWVHLYERDGYKQLLLSLESRANQIRGSASE